MNYSEKNKRINENETAPSVNRTSRSAAGGVVKGAAIIGAAGIVVKLLGAIFKIPITNWMGSVGMSYYQIAYVIYSVLIVLSTAGFPVAISKLVSENNARGMYANSKKIFKTSLGIMMVLGGASAAICFFGANAYANYVENPLAAQAIRAIAPALIFVPILSSFRGFFQGRRNMNPTAISEIFEQFIRVIVGFALTRILLNKGLPEAAAGASFGAAAGSLIAVGILILAYSLHKERLRKEISRGRPEVEDTKVIIKKIFMIAVPIIIGAEIIPIMYSIDATVTMKRLVACGWSQDESKYLYGLMAGYCNSLVNMPEFLIQAIAISIVPAISHASAKGDHQEVDRSILTGYKLTTLIAFPSMVGLLVLCKPILSLLYPERVDEAMEAIPIFIVMTFSIVTLAMYETSTGALQAIGKQIIPLRNVAICAVIKVVLTFILVGIKSINVIGAAASSVAAYLIAFILNEIAVRKYTGVRPDVLGVFVKPFIASVVMGACAYGSFALLKGILGSNFSVLIAIMVGVVSYFVMVIAIKVVTPEEVEDMPKGEKLNGLIRKFVKGWR